MQQLIIHVEERRHSLLVQLLRTLGYVKITPPSEFMDSPNLKSKELPLPTNQLELLQNTLKHQSKPLFQTLKKPSEWQKSERDEWA